MNCPACEHTNVDGARYCAKCGVLMPVAEGTSTDPMIGTIVGGRYRVTRLLGEGGMGRVYVGEQQMGTAVRQVAIKTLLEEFSRDPQVQGRFHRECGTVVGLEHANTIKFYDFGTTDSGDLYIAMEFVDGKPLADVIAADGRMTSTRVEHIMKQICGSLHEAHEKGIIHRDLKPDNVILTERAGEKDFVKVLDFGIAKRSDAADQAREQKLTQAGMVLGTPPYMSPEQFTGKELDRRSDVYSLGVMAYEMLTGKLPFDANTAWEWATQHMTAQPFPFEARLGELAASIPSSMKEAIRRALSKHREERQPTAREFYAELSGNRSTGAHELASGATPSFQAPGATQIGEPFVPPGGAQGHATPGAGMTQAGFPTPMGGVVQAGYGATSGSVPVAHYPNPGVGSNAGAYGAPHAGRQGGGGLKVGAIVGIGLVIACIGAGAFWFSQGDDDSSDVPLAKTAKPSATASAAPSDEPAATASAETPPDTAASTAASDDDSPPGDESSTGASSAPTATTPTAVRPVNTGSTKPPPPPPSGGGCDSAISLAGQGNCGAAQSAMGGCSGPRRSIAQANVTRCFQKKRGR